MLQLFSSVSLGPLLGRGSYGRVHRGVWQGQQIAVKVPHLHFPKECLRTLKTSFCRSA